MAGFQLFSMIFALICIGQLSQQQDKGNTLVSFGLSKPLHCCIFALFQRAGCSLR